MTLTAHHIAPVAALALVACAPQQETVGRAAQPFEPKYLGIETALLDGDLVSFGLRMTGAREKQDVVDYGECAAARYALIRGYGFARHVRTNVNMSGDVWTGDAVYVISDALPEGLRTIDAEVTAAACNENGIPTI